MPTLPRNKRSSRPLEISEADLRLMVEALTTSANCLERIMAGETQMQDTLEACHALISKSMKTPMLIIHQRMVWNQTMREICRLSSLAIGRQ